MYLVQSYIESNLDSTYPKNQATDNLVHLWIAWEVDQLLSFLPVEIVLWTEIDLSKMNSCLDWLIGHQNENIPTSIITLYNAL
jgi:hypothetical protein